MQALQTVDAEFEVKVITPAQRARGVALAPGLAPAAGGGLRLTEGAGAGAGLGVADARLAVGSVGLADVCGSSHRGGSPG